MVMDDWMVFMKHSLRGLKSTLGTYPRIWGFADDSSAVVQLLTLDGAVIDNEANNLILCTQFKGILGQYLQC